MSQEKFNYSPSDKENREESQRHTEAQVSHKTIMQAKIKTIKMHLHEIQKRQFLLMQEMSIAGLESLECQVGEAQFFIIKNNVIIERQNTAEIKTINLMLHELQEKEEFLLEENSSITAELSNVESERDGQKKDNTNLRKALENLECKVSEAQDLIIKNNEIIKKQNRAEIKTIQMHLHEIQKKQAFLFKQKRSIAALETPECQAGEAHRLIIQNNDIIERQYREIVYKWELIDDLYKVLETRLQTAQDLKDVLSMVQKQNVLADVKNVQEECQIAGELLQLENPPGEVQTSDSWRCGAKRLLKVGLGLATAGLVACWAFSKMFN
ncbi:unnamed protein product [Oreochromis niloticus]|nr:unnamed protein product [Mustela putorius furo]